ncbi:hypothetical protein CACET_c10370 [Clostridium aceticum]|uniref:DUF8180 domain-containing protein n=1 Tax=Clostridium aceticum TaxID=84022 RepID=A0A0D8ID65_9CLOT|nr:hypothetical protein [Clostridium aceticum]AKL94540.1 hypothetical protein CACET_c10370 [Clostridium aceticum]KJF28255.1 zinc transporter [Clostridium aceticum]
MCCNDNNHSHEHHHHHSHEHSHDHDHDHHHGCCSDDSHLSQDEKTLRVLLVHWINHNRTHQDSFLEWVEKAKNMDKAAAADNIQKAVEFMEKANEMLIEAKKHM